MRFIKQGDGLAKILAAALNEALAKNERVIWLVPGGSNVIVAAEASKLVDRALSKKLIVMQTDERFVGSDSPDCNWRQLSEAGFDTKKAKTYPMLGDQSLDLEQTAEHYQKIVDTQFSKADYILGQFGVGANGHIAGIMPGSIAAKTKDLVAGYHAEDFARVSLTFAAIKQLDSAITFAYGKSKLPALQQLESRKSSLEALPSGILNSITSSTIYNDQIESEEQK